MWRFVLAIAILRSVSGLCPDSTWVESGTSCFSLVLTYCGGLSAPASIHSTQESNAIGRLLSSSGVSAAGTGGYVTASYTTFGMLSGSWMDGTSFDFNNFPNGLDGQRGCIIIDSSGGWSTARTCPLATVCRVSSHTAPPTTSRPTVATTLAPTTTIAPTTAVPNTTTVPILTVAPNTTAPTFAPNTSQPVPNTTSVPIVVNTTSVPNSTAWTQPNTTFPNTTLAPPNATLAPPNTTLAPLNTTLAPPNTTMAPPNTTLAPPNTTLAPPNITVAPNTTAAPPNTTVAVNITLAPNTTIAVNTTNATVVLNTTSAPIVSTPIPAVVIDTSAFINITIVQYDINPILIAVPGAQGYTEITVQDCVTLRNITVLGGLCQSSACSFQPVPQLFAASQGGSYCAMGPTGTVLNLTLAVLPFKVDPKSLRRTSKAVASEYPYMLFEGDEVSSAGRAFFFTISPLIPSNVPTPKLSQYELTSIDFFIGSSCDLSEGFDVITATDWTGSTSLPTFRLALPSSSLGAAFQSAVEPMLCIIYGDGSTEQVSTLKKTTQFATAVALDTITTTSLIVLPIKSLTGMTSDSAILLKVVAYDVSLSAEPSCVSASANGYPMTVGSVSSLTASLRIVVPRPSSATKALICLKSLPAETLFPFYDDVVYAASGIKKGVVITFASSPTPIQTIPSSIFTVQLINGGRGNIPIAQLLAGSSVAALVQAEGTQVQAVDCLPNQLTNRCNNVNSQTQSIQIVNGMIPVRTAFQAPENTTSNKCLCAVYDAAGSLVGVDLRVTLILAPSGVSSAGTCISSPFLANQKPMCGLLPRATRNVTVLGGQRGIFVQTVPIYSMKYAWTNGVGADCTIVQTWSPASAVIGSPLEWFADSLPSAAGDYTLCLNVQFTSSNPTVSLPIGVVVTVVASGSPATVPGSAGTPASGAVSVRCNFLGSTTLQLPCTSTAVLLSCTFPSNYVPNRPQVKSANDGDPNWGFTQLVVDRSDGALIIQTRAVTIQNRCFQNPQPIRLLVQDDAVSFFMDVLFHAPQLTSANPVWLTQGSSGLVASGIRYINGLSGLTAATSQTASCDAIVQRLYLGDGAVIRPTSSNSINVLYLCVFSTLSQRWVPFMQSATTNVAIAVQAPANTFGTVQLQNAFIPTGPLVIYDSQIIAFKSICIGTCSPIALSTTPQCTGQSSFLWQSDAPDPTIYAANLVFIGVPLTWCTLLGNSWTPVVVNSVFSQTIERRKLDVSEIESQKAVSFPFRSNSAFTVALTSVQGPVSTIGLYLKGITGSCMPNLEIIRLVIRKVDDSYLLDIPANATRPSANALASVGSTADSQTVPAQLCVSLNSNNFIPASVQLTLTSFSSPFEFSEFLVVDFSKEPDSQTVFSMDAAIQSVAGDVSSFTQILPSKLSVSAFSGTSVRVEIPVSALNSNLRATATLESVFTAMAKKQLKLRDPVYGWSASRVGAFYQRNNSLVPSLGQVALSTRFTAQPTSIPMTTLAPKVASGTATFLKVIIVIFLLVVLPCIVFVILLVIKRARRRPQPGPKDPDTATEMGQSPPRGPTPSLSQAVGTPISPSPRKPSAAMELLSSVNSKPSPPRTPLPQTKEKERELPVLQPAPVGRPTEVRRSPQVPALSQGSHPPIDIDLGHPPPTQSVGREKDPLACSGSSDDLK